MSLNTTVQSHSNASALHRNCWWPSAQ